MAITEGIFRFHSLRFNGAQFGGTTVLGGISTNAINPNPEVIQNFSDGSPYPTFNTLASFAEEASFSTTNIDTALDLIGASGNCLEDGSSIEIFYARYDGCNIGPTPGSVHRKATITQSGSNGGLIYGSSLSADHRGDASYSFSIAPQSDGTNSPIALASNVALPTGVIDNTNRYTIGPAQIAGVTIDGIKNINVELGVTVERESADSSVFDEYFSISQLATKLSISGINPSWWDNAKLGTIGKEATHADTSFVLRKRLKGTAGFVPQATAEHIRLTTAGLAVPSTYFESSGSSPISSALDIYSVFDGTNVPLVANTGVSY